MTPSFPWATCSNSWQLFQNIQSKSPQHNVRLVSLFLSLWHGRKRPIPTFVTLLSGNSLNPLIQIIDINRTGNDTEPWGTQVVASYELDITPFLHSLGPATQAVFYPDNTAPVQAMSKQPVSPGENWEKVSKTLLQFRYTTSTAFCSSTKWVILSQNEIMLVKRDLSLWTHAVWAWSPVAVYVPCDGNQGDLLPSPVCSFNLNYIFFLHYASLVHNCVR